MDQRKSTAKASLVRSATIAGAAATLILGGAVFGGSFDLTRTTPALADAVVVEGVEPLSFADVVEKVRPAVVSVRVKSATETVSGDDFFEFFDLPPGSPMERFFRQFRENPPEGLRPPRRSQISVGSGFFISEDGFVVTNNHVIDGEESVAVILDDGTEYSAEVIGKDDRTDLALLKIDASRDFTYVRFATSEPRVGDWVVAVGNPFGLGGTVTAGIISAHGRQIGAGPYDDFLQIDAAVNRGNSGGPAFNFKGEVIGVNTAIFSPSGGNVGIAFAIPASTASRIVDDLSDDGTVVRGWLGVQIQAITRDIADGLDLDEAKGALVGEVQSDSPAAAAGFEVGDAILAVNGEEVEDSRDLALRISSMEPGTTVTVTYVRDGTSRDVEVELDKLPPPDRLASLSPQPEESPAVSSLDDFGLSLGAAKDGRGVVVSEIDPNGQAAEQGLQAGDVIVSIGDRLVRDPSDVEEAIEAAKASGAKAVLLRVRSGGRTKFVPLRLAS